MSEEYFADAVVSISLLGPTVRIDFASTAHDGEWTPPAGNTLNEPRPPLLKRFRVIMPMEGFMQAFNAQENLVQQLINSGTIKREKTPV